MAPSRLPVGSSASRICGPRREGARQRDALLLAAGELGGVVVAALAEADALEQGARARRAAAPAGELERQQDVLERGQVRQQLERLEDEADLPPPQPRQGVLGEVLDRRAVDAGPRRSVGRSRPATSPSSVDLPLPEGPRMATNSPGATARSTASRIVSMPVARRQALGQLAELDGRGGVIGVIAWGARQVSMGA